MPECCPTRVSRSRTHSCSCVIVARCSAIVARSSTTSACRVPITDGITQQNVQRNPPGTLPRHDPVNGYPATWAPVGAAPVSASDAFTSLGRAGMTGVAWQRAGGRTAGDPMGPASLATGRAGSTGTRQNQTHTHRHDPYIHQSVHGEVLRGAPTAFRSRCRAQACSISLSVGTGIRPPQQTCLVFCTGRTAAMPFRLCMNELTDAPLPMKGRLGSMPQWWTAWKTPKQVLPRPVPKWPVV